MPKTALDQWDVVPGNNKDVDGINCDEGWAPSNVNNVIRAIMAQVKKAVANQGADIASAATVNIGAANCSYLRITGTTAITAFDTIAAGKEVWVEFTGPLTLTHNATTLILPGAANITTAAGDMAKFISRGSGNWKCADYVRASGLPIVNPPVASPVPVRQTVLAGPLDTNGLPSFGGATGSTTVTASGTLTVTAANGWSLLGQTDRIGQIVNPSWTSLSTNGTMYLYLDIAADGTCTTGSTTLQPTYRWGGADVVTNNQFTFNIQDMIGKVGNGATAAQAYRVFVGEVTVAAGVVSAIVWYAVQGRYASPQTTFAASSSNTVSHNLGMQAGSFNVGFLNVTAAMGYSVGQIIWINAVAQGAGGTNGYSISSDRMTASLQAASNIYFMPAGGGTNTVITFANWRLLFFVGRGW